MISDRWFVPVDLAGVFFEQSAFYAPLGRRDALLMRAGAAGIRSALLVDDSLRRRPPADSEVLSDGWLRFAPVSLRELRLD